MSDQLSEAYYVLELGDNGMNGSRVLCVCIGQGSGLRALKSAEDFAKQKPGASIDVARCRTRISFPKQPVEFTVKEFE